MKKWLKFGITNFITFLRVIGIILLIPVFRMYGGIVTFFLSAFTFFTDCLDGLLARKLESSTFFGSLFDGATDKMFLIVNMILLMSITPLAIIPIVFELGIAFIQSVKYYNNMNVKSNMFGKIKMWVAGIVISLTYLLVDKNLVNYMGIDMLNKINNVSELKLLVALLSPLVISEVITLSSYFKEYKVEKENTNKITEEEEIKEEIKNADLKDLLFEHSYYEKLKEEGNLKLVRDLVRTRKK